MRPRPLVLAVAATAVAAVIAPAIGLSRPSAAGTARAGGVSSFLVSGRGYGHGVGLSQCGALGYAKHGWTYRQILGHYYPGTAIAKAPPTSVRILLASGRRSLTVGSSAAFRVKDASGATAKLPAGSYAVTTALKLPVGDAGKPQALPGPLTFLPGRQPVTLGGAYRGAVVVSVKKAALQALNVVSLDQYLYSVVPREIGRVGTEALKAQAVAARSFALATHKSADFDVYPDSRSQVYGGIKSEYPESTAAVNASAGEILTYKGQVITAFYSASSGGRTAAVEDTWAGSKPVPYLVSVQDPYDDYCATSHSWGPASYSGAALAAKLRVPGVVLDARTTTNRSRRVTTLLVTTTKAQKSFTGDAVRARLGLKSTWFWIGVLSLAPPTKPAVYGSPAELTGVARKVGAVALEQRPAGAAWSRAGRLKPAPDGTVAVGVRPSVATRYRLVAGKAASAVVRLGVSPRITLRLEPPDGVSGKVRPVSVAGSVQIQRLTGTIWKTARTAPIAHGAYAAVVPLSPGTYRARVASGRGFAPGVSEPVRVVG